jgi:hypothetical protein
MRSLLSAAFALALWGTGAPAQVQFKPADGPAVINPAAMAPQLRLAQVEGDKLHIDRMLPVQEKRTVQEVQEIDGKKVPVLREVVVTVYRVVRESIPLKDLKVAGLDGKPLDAATVARRLAKPTAVVMVFGEPVVAPEYRALFRDDVVVISAPPPQVRPAEKPEEKPR